MTRTPTYRVVEGIGRTLRGCGLVSVSLEPEELCGVAQRRAGLTDFGGDEFRAPLAMLVGSLEREARLTFVGRVLVREILIQKLINRLLLADSIRRHPEILDVEIREPIIITGLPRTGTTLLHRILAQDEALRHLQMWEVWKPAPPPDPSSHATDPRRDGRAYNNSDAPGLAGVVCTLEDRLIGAETIRKRQAAHFVGMSEPEECQLLFMNSFTSQEFVLFFADAVPSYAMWLLDQSLLEPYAYYRRQLQLLTWKFPGRRLILKSPQHVQSLGALFAVLPDAKVVWCHREPRSVVLSWCHLNRIDGEIYNDASPGGARRLGPSVLNWLGTELDRALDVLPSLPQEQVVHVSYRQSVADPVAFALALRKRLGLGEGEAATKQMETWMSGNGKHANGAPKYDAAAYGLTAEVIDERFASYRRAFAGLL
jgi:Sulfotransferase family